MYLKIIIIPVIVIIIYFVSQEFNKYMYFLFQGYYMNNDVFGQAGDFITSPEISQVFGEVLSYFRKYTFPSMPPQHTYKHTYRTIFALNPTPLKILV